MRLPRASGLRIRLRIRPLSRARALAGPSAAAMSKMQEK